MKRIDGLKDEGEVTLELSFTLDPTDEVSDFRNKLENLTPQQEAIFRQNVRMPDNMTIIELFDLYMMGIVSIKKENE